MGRIVQDEDFIETNENKVSMDQPAEGNSRRGPYKIIDPSSITILEELKNYLFRPKATDLLRSDILERGVKDPVKIWERKNDSGAVDLILYDGFHRHDFATEGGLQLPALITDEFDSLDEVKAEMDRIQLERRNLNIFQRAYSIGRRYDAVRDPENRVKFLLKRSLPNGEAPEAYFEALAEELNVPPRTMTHYWHLFNGMRKLQEKNDELFTELIRDPDHAKITIDDMVHYSKVEYSPEQLNTMDDLREHIRQDKLLARQAIPPKNKDIAKEIRSLGKKSIKKIERFMIKPTMNNRDEIMEMLTRMVRLAEAKKTEGKKSKATPESK